MIDARLSPHGYQLQGTFKNFNTIEEFRSPEAKKAVFDKVADDVGIIRSAPSADETRSSHLSSRMSQHSMTSCF